MKPVHFPRTEGKMHCSESTVSVEWKAEVQGVNGWGGDEAGGLVWMAL